MKSTIMDLEYQLHKWWVILPIILIGATALLILGYVVGQEDKELELFGKYKRCYIENIIKNKFPLTDSEYMSIIMGDNITPFNHIEDD